MKPLEREFAQLTTGFNFMHRKVLVLERALVLALTVIIALGFLLVIR